MRRVGRGGNAVAGERIVDLQLLAATNAPSQARRQVAALAAHLPQRLREDLQLLVSELVANSLRHAQLGEEDSICLWARVGDDSIRVEVSDCGQGFQLWGDPTSPEALARSGLWMLDQIADRWGLVRDGSTKVWFEADLPVSLVPGWREVIASWPPAPQATAHELSRLHGPPDEATPDELRWRKADGTELTMRYSPDV
jgi:anti-sigma regulatory factor (Ser/Thr protein kinase)